MLDVQALRDLLDQHRSLVVEKSELSAQTKRLRAKLEDHGGPGALSLEDTIELLQATVDMLVARVDTLETQQDGLWDSMLEGIIGLVDKAPSGASG
jgi:hypothetical protein